jgi:hypothetical protein
MDAAVADYDYENCETLRDLIWIWGRKSERVCRLQDCGIWKRKCGGTERKDMEVVGSFLS